jgi:predicted nucleic acid-binding protein
MALSWCLRDESAPNTESVLRSIVGKEVLVPAHWYLEVANALLMAERRGRTTAAETTRAVALLGELRIRPDQMTSDLAMTASLSLARSEALTVYDAAYLELCLREGLPVATLDADLAAAARRLGVPVVNI